jgi:hypothetical protein
LPAPDSPTRALSDLGKNQHPRVNGSLEFERIRDPTADPTLSRLVRTGRVSTGLTGRPGTLLQASKLLLAEVPYTPPR